MIRLLFVCSVVIRLFFCLFGGDSSLICLFGGDLSLLLFVRW